MQRDDWLSLFLVLQAWGFARGASDGVHVAQQGGRGGFGSQRSAHTTVSRVKPIPTLSLFARLICLCKFYPKCSFFAACSPKWPMFAGVSGTRNAIQ